MNKIFGLILGIGAFAAIHAAPITTFVDVYDPSPDIKMMVGSPTESHTYTHNIVDNGFTPGGYLVTSASLFLTLEDDTDFLPVRETFRIRLDGVTVVDNVVMLGSYLVNVNTQYLQKDGILTVKLTAREGDFYFRKSELTVTATAVPEPGSVALLGIGLIGIGFAVRRRSKA